MALDEFHCGIEIVLNWMGQQTLILFYRQKRIVTSIIFIIYWGYTEDWTFLKIYFIYGILEIFWFVMFLEKTMKLYIL